MKDYKLIPKIALWSLMAIGVRGNTRGCGRFPEYTSFLEPVLGLELYLGMPCRFDYSWCCLLGVCENV